MKVEVNLENILKYGLDVITGNSRADLLAAAARAAEVNEVMHVIIPDVEGGDTEAPTERNSFEHFGDLPAPEEATHMQSNGTAYGRTKLRLTERSLIELKTMALADGLTEEEWDYWVANAVEVIDNPYRGKGL